MQHATYPFSDCQDPFWQPGGVNSRWICTTTPQYPADYPQDVGAWTNVLQNKPEIDQFPGAEDSYLVASGLAFPRGHGYYLRVRHAFSLEKGAGGRFEMKTASGWQPIEPMAGYPGIIEAEGTSLDGEAGFTGTSSVSWWQTDLFDFTSVGYDIPTVRFHIVRSSGESWWTIDAVDLVLAAYARPTPPPDVRERRSKEVVNDFNSNLHTQAVENLGSIDQEEIPAVVNSFEWYGIDPNSLVANYGPFNTPTELKSPRWSFSFTRDRTFSSPDEAASYFTTRVVPRLFGVANPSMVLVAESQQASQNQQRSVFKYYQQFAGRPVSGASLILELEGQDQLYRVSSTLVPVLKAPLFATIQPDPAVELVKDHLVATLGIERDSVLIEDVELEYVTGTFINKGVSPYITHRVEYSITSSGESGTAWVDGWSTGVLKTSSRTRYLNALDRISDGSSVTIGGGGSVGGVLWQGDPSCGYTGYPPPSHDACCLGPPWCLQDNVDIYETQMAFQHIEDYFAGLSPDVCGTYVTDWRSSWTSSHPYLLAAVGANAQLSIGVNNTSTGRTTYALHTAVPDVVGHEVGHTVNRSRMTGLEEDTVGSYPFWQSRMIEGNAIDEAMADNMGVIIESMVVPEVRDDI